MGDLVEGMHSDPFSVLGPHGHGSRCKVTTLQPHARSVQLVCGAGTEAHAMQRIHEGGLFEATLPKGETSYRLLVQSATGEQTDIEDPYRFGSPLGKVDLHLFAKGHHKELHRKLGAHTLCLDGVSGTHFAVWAPNAKRISVVGDFNNWDGRRHPMRAHPDAGVWDIFLPGVGHGDAYKFELLDRDGKLLPLKGDPIGSHYEAAPGNASRVYESNYQWSDDQWMVDRKQASDSLASPLSVYEVHLGSWRRRSDKDNRPLTYRELADDLVAYVVDHGFTHIELMPVTEHPFDGSWGYQPIGMFAPTHRFGEPDDFRYFIDACHQAQIGVIVDWVAAHFPRDEHGLSRFDGTPLYEHPDPSRADHPDWGTLIFDYGRPEVSNYLVASALCWVQDFHIDGLRVDAVASMLYLDYSRDAGDWSPNVNGGNENLEAVALIKQINEAVHAVGALTFAEESTAWPSVSRPTYDGGLGFTYKWNMGWMNDTLAYMEEEPVHRKFHHDRLTFGLTYAYSENFLLPLSHDEVVHGKRSLISKMPGDEWQRFANLRAYLAFMFGHPGKKLLFMGAEFAQHTEWNYADQLDWHLKQQSPHAGVARLVKQLNDLYRSNTALHQLDCDPTGFEWIDIEDRDASVIAWQRRDRDGNFVVCVSNFTPVVRHDYRIGVPAPGTYKEILCTDDQSFGGSGVVNSGSRTTVAEESHAHSNSIALMLPPLATIYIQLSSETEEGKRELHERSQ